MRKQAELCFQGFKNLHDLRSFLQWQLLFLAKQMLACWQQSQATAQIL